MSHCGWEPSAEPRICEPGGGNLLPLGFARDSEQRWPIPLRAILYMLGLGWCFMGVAIVSDIFMNSIERITSQKKRVLNKRTGRMMTTIVWNATVANLTLMALGSSAPEILLSTIEICFNNFVAGDLGPSTIVGSAAFNLLCITAVCVIAIPDGEVRYIKDTNVYACTATFSIFAYVWLIFILLGTSPDRVEVWEGIVTFLLFPFFISTSYLVDRGYIQLPFAGEMGKVKSCLADCTPEEIEELTQIIKKRHAASPLTDEQVQTLLEAEFGRPNTRSSYRGVAGLRAAYSRQGPDPLMEVVPIEGATSDEIADGKQAVNEAVCGFMHKKYAVLESVGTVRLPVIREGDLTKTCVVKYSTREGTALVDSDFMAVSGSLTFKPGEKEQIIEIDIVDDNAHEEEEEFYLDLDLDESCEPGVVLSEEKKSMTVVIIDDDDPGVLYFAQEEVTVEEPEEDTQVNLVIQRKSGCAGRVGCSFCTENATALAGTHYEEASDTIELEPSQVSAVISVTVKAQKLSRSEMFRVVLSAPFGGARLDHEGDGGADHNICTVIIRVDESRLKEPQGIVSALKRKWERSKADHLAWRDQFTEALYPTLEDEDSKPGPVDWAMHVVTVPWKVLFALVPPTSYLNGWACFVCSLLMIGFVTAFVSDLAKLLGCVICVPEEITAITFVALGTSLPDTFASKTAATMDEHADASIGNVTGSNSVNVFLGIGISWTMAAVHWEIKGVDFEVKAGSLAFSVAVFSCCACVCLVVLYLRRRHLGGELGGSRKTKWATSAFLVGLWSIYITLSSWYAFATQ